MAPPTGAWPGAHWRAPVGVVGGLPALPGQPVKRSRLKPAPPKRRAQIPEATMRAVYDRTNGRCACGCGRAAMGCPHHVFPVQRWPELELEPANLIAVSPVCHGRHEAAFLRFTRRAVWPAECLATTPSMEDFLARTYPEE